MNKRILLGIDTNFSTTTQSAIRAVGDLFEPGTAFDIFLLHAIQSTHIITEYPGHFTEQYAFIPPTNEQKKHAEEVLKKARATLDQLGFDLKHIEMMTSIGSPAEEIVRVARERHVNLIVVGSRGDSWRDRLRRMLLGSTSRRVLQLASCPVMVVLPAPPLKAQELVPWYEQTIKNYLNEQSSVLTVLTAKEVVTQFPPPQKKTVGGQEIQAAERALEQLASKGLLCRREIQGEVHYIND
ncbi:universal stress protein [Dictyobacter aurantiacus]|uniref:UspA domain-containing protein n=1 Tax=Dictyobacter aurantiacus TaxID=1936993 RepID=A0A401ZF79_9CHLR|nr:universal stress protein [Dictyobacter aurantiacus]GCE05499.1 hypothetical protein KDAU_28280 [Dictyobacter aurantiacus]